MGGRGGQVKYRSGRSVDARQLGQQSNTHHVSARLTLRVASRKVAAHVSGVFVFLGSDNLPVQVFPISVQFM
jgi:hypothetical protein